MPESEHQQSQQIRQRLEALVQGWSQGKVTLREVFGLTDEELYAMASQGYLLFLQGKTEAARVLFECCVSCDPKNAYYYRALGCIYWRSKEPKKAIQQFTYAIRVAPREVSTYVNRAEVCVALKLWDRARSDLAQAIRLSGQNDSALVQKARAIQAMVP